MALASGRQIGPYKILGSLGRGGMGEVYRAQDPRLDREVAVKVLPEDIAADPDALKRFEREAKAVAALSHPNILEIHDFGTDQGISYAVTELLEGQTLRSMIGAGAVSLEKAVKIGTAVSDGLAAAHSKGIIHRDLKPENIFLTTDDRVKILDFGLAKRKSQTAPEMTSAATETRVTETGALMGTVPYMSPEQLIGAAVDHRTDIFSLGCVLYELLAGGRAFRGNTSAETISAILRDEPRELPKSTPPELSQIIAHCLEKNPEKRFHSAHDLAFALREFGTHGTSTRTGELRVSTIAVWLIVLAAVATALLFGLRRPSIPRTPHPKIESLAVLPLKNLSHDPKQEYFSDGMTEELIARLANIESLKVISRTSVMDYKQTTKKIPEIAKELNVDAIIEGSVMQSGDRVRITAQLIDASSDRHLWAESYERDLHDVLTLQDEVARAIASEIQIKLTPRDQSRLAAKTSVNPAAYQAYLRGLDYSSIANITEEGTRLAEQMFQRAVDLDPKFGRAYAFLSKTHSFLYIAWDHTDERLKKAKTAVDRALELEPGLAEAHLALGYYNYWGHNDYEEALKEFSAASKDLPNNSVVLLAIASVQRRQGKFDESIQNMKQALELDPKNALIAWELGGTYSVVRNYSEADRLFDRAIFLAPDTVPAYGNKAMNYWLWKGETKMARATLEKMPAPGDPWWWLMEEIYERNYQKALERLSAAPDQPFTDWTEFYPKALYAARIYRLLNQLVKAHDSFEAARLQLEKETKARPEDHRIHASLGIVYAGLGRKDDAILEGKLAMQMYPVSKDTLKGPDYVINLAKIYVMLGEKDAALDKIEYGLSIPFSFSVGLLKLDPEWDPLRSHPRYKKLISSLDKK